MRREGSVTVTVPGHFGELLQGRLGAQGPVALITLPCPALTVRGWYQPGGRFQLHSPDRLVSPQRARRFLNLLGADATGRFVLRADMPVGGGAGASTAALVALARLAAPQSTSQQIAAACIEIEGATDPLMFPAPERRLWASRQAESVATLPTLPRFEVLGGFFGPPHRTRAEDADFADISDLLPAWEKAAQTADLSTLARLCSTAAERTLQRRGPAGDPTAALARDLGAQGYVIAHTGSARGLIFAPGRVPADGAAILRAAGFRRTVHFKAGGTS